MHVCERCGHMLYYHERGRATVCVLCAAFTGQHRICDRFPVSHYTRLLHEYVDPVTTAGVARRRDETVTHEPEASV